MDLYCCGWYIFCYYLFLAYKRNRYKYLLFYLLSSYKKRISCDHRCDSLICYPFMKKVNHKYLKYLLLGLLALPTLSGIDLLSFGDGYSVPFTFILFYLGVIEAHEDNHFSFIPFIIVGLMDVLCKVSCHYVLILYMAICLLPYALRHQHLSLK